MASTREVRNCPVCSKEPWFCPACDPEPKQAPYQRDNRAKRDRVRERCAHDPEYAEHQRELRRARDRRRKRNPDYWKRKAARAAERQRERALTDPAYREQKRLRYRLQHATEIVERNRFRAERDARLAFEKEVRRQQRLAARLSPEELKARQYARRKAWKEQNPERARALAQASWQRSMAARGDEIRAQHQRNASKPEARERHRLRDREREAKRRAIFDALRELGWLKGYELQLPISTETPTYRRRRTNKQTNDAL